MTYKTLLQDTTITSEANRNVQKLFLGAIWLIYKNDWDLSINRYKRSGI